MRRFGKGFASVCAFLVGAGCAAGCGGVVDPGYTDGGPFGVGADAGVWSATDAGTPLPAYDAGTPLPAYDAGTPSPATCPPGGPAGSSPLLLGPPPGGPGDLWRGLDDGAGEGESFIVPRAGVIDRVVVQIFADPGVRACRTRIYRYCEGQRVLVASTDTPASAFPVYIIDAQPGANMWQQDLRMTSVTIDPPVPVAAGDRVEAVFSAVGSHPYSVQLVSVITMDDITPNAKAVFPDGAPGIPDYASDNWDYHAQIELR